MALLRTPLYELHKSKGAFFVEFAGCEMPLHYGSILAEHKVVREKVGLFDVSHMGVMKIQGAAAEKLLNDALTQDITHLKNHHACYSLMCNLSGGVMDDIMVNRVDQNEFLLCLNAVNTGKDVDWLMAGKDRYGCFMQDLSKRYGILALQGPLAAKLMLRLVGTLDNFNRFDVKEMGLRGSPIYVGRTGYTGEDGFEIYCEALELQSVVDTILEHGEDLGLQLCGLGARDSLRLESGYCLYGHELSEEINPFEAGLDHFVKLEKPSGFIGCDALMNIKKKGLKRKVVFFKLPEGNIPRPGMTVHEEAHLAGKVLSGTLSPMLNQGVGTAMINMDVIDRPLEVIIRERAVPLEIVEPPFYKSPHLAH